MKLLRIYALAITSIMLSLGVALYHVESPEKKIIGTWSEKSWEYEKVYGLHDLEKLKPMDSVSQSVKDELGKHLVIHSAEVWRFSPDGRLFLQGSDTLRIVKWKLKGRGHILELEYADHVIEHYNLTELADDTMVLNFDSDMQVKGVAKLSFDKMTSHVTKI